MGRHWRRYNIYRVFNDPGNRNSLEKYILTFNAMINFLENERVILMLRRHPLIIYTKIAAIVLIAVVPFVIYPFIRKFLPQILVYPRDILLVLGAVIYYMFVWTYFLIVWVDYYLDMWIVTNQRIMDIEQKGLFSREVSEFSISRVQDVTVNVIGILPTLFHYGDVHVQTAGEAKQFIFRDIRDPNKVKDAILNLQYKTLNT